APVVVAAAELDRVDAVVDWWDRRRTDAGVDSFVAEDADVLVVCVPSADAAALDELAAHFGVRVGVSEPADYTGFARAQEQALAALRRGGRGTGAVRFAQTVGGGVLDALDTDEARLLAGARLAPLRRHDQTAGAELERTLRVWLEHDAHAERTAAALGIHRHTLRTRIAQAAGLLGAALSSFPARAELGAVPDAA